MEPSLDKAAPLAASPGQSSSISSLRTQDLGGVSGVLELLSALASASPWPLASPPTAPPLLLCHQEILLPGPCESCVSMQDHPADT